MFYILPSIWILLQPLFYFFSFAADGTLFLHVINRKRGGWTVEIMRKHHSCVYCSGNVCSRQTWDLLLTWGKSALKQMEKMNQDKDTKSSLQNTQKCIFSTKRKLNFCLVFVRSGTTAVLDVPLEVFCIVLRSISFQF